MEHKAAAHPYDLNSVDEHAVNKSEDMVADARNFSKAELDKSQPEHKMSREIKVVMTLLV